MNIVGHPQAPVYGICAEFGSAAELFRAAGQIREAGFTRFDVFSPFPIPGMSEAMGLRPSGLGKVVFLGGLLGFLSAVVLEYGPSTFIYPLVVMGKPTGFFSAPAFFPIMFELTILGSALTAFFGLFLINGLPRWHHPVFHWDRFKKASDDGFFCVIERSDPQFATRDIAGFLASLGAQHITEVHEEA